MLVHAGVIFILILYSILHVCLFVSLSLKFVLFSLIVLGSRKHPVLCMVIFYLFFFCFGLLLFTYVCFELKYSYIIIEYIIKYKYNYTIYEINDIIPPFLPPAPPTPSNWQPHFLLKSCINECLIC